MKINAPKENYIFIELSEQDMKELNVTYDNIFCPSGETEKAVKNLLYKVEDALGRRFENTNGIKADILPSIDGGCLLFFAVNQKPLRYRLKSRESNLWFETDDIDNIIDLSRALCLEEINGIDSSLYSYDGKLLLVIKGKIKHSLLMKLNEFLTPVRDRKCRKGDCLIKKGILASFISASSV